MVTLFGIVILVSPVVPKHPPDKVVTELGIVIDVREVQPLNKYVSNFVIPEPKNVTDDKFVQFLKHPLLTVVTEAGITIDSKLLQ
jgi:hypothetical protein